MKEAVKRNTALTILEMVIAVSIVAVIFAVIVPQFRNISNNWDSKCANSEMLQNARILMDHMNRHLSEASRVTAVSDSSQTAGYIEFEDPSENVFRYCISGNKYVAYGTPGSVTDLAGPVTEFRFTCYNILDLETEIMNVDKIRCIEVDVTFANVASLTQDKTFSSKIYLRTNAIHELLHLKLDESSGIVTEDFAGENDGTLYNGPVWDPAGGNWGGCLSFDGDDDYVEFGPLNIYSNKVTISAWINRSGDQAGWAGLVHCRAGNTVAGISVGNTTELRYHWNNDFNTYSWNSTHIVPGGRWCFIALVVEPDKASYYFEDGSMNVRVNNIPHDIEEFDGVMWLGRDKQSEFVDERYFKGALDDIRIYDFALTPEEVNHLFVYGHIIVP